MDKIKSNWKAGLLPLYAIIVLLVVSFLSSYTATDAEKLFLTPVFDDANGWEIYTLEHNVRKDKTVQELFDSTGETFYLSRTLDKQMERDGYTILELDGVTWQQSVFLDGELLYSVDPSLDNRIGSVEFSREYKGLQRQGEYVRLSLPSGYSGKTLTIALAAHADEEYRGMPMVRMSSQDIQTQQTVSDANGLAMPATAYMAAAVLLLGLFFYNWYHGQKSYSILLLAAAALIQSLRVLLNFEFYFSTHFSLKFIPAQLLIPLSLGMPLLYLFTQMQRWKKWYAPFLLIPLGLSILFHQIAGFSMFAFLSNYSYDALLYVSLLALGVFAILEWKDRNAVYRLFTPVFFSVAACILLAALGFVLTGNADATFVVMLCSPVTMLYEVLQRCGSLLLILGGTVSFVLTVKNAADTKSELSILSVKNELISENIQSMQESSTEIATMRHDMLRHLHMMLDLSHEGDKERLENYLEELTKETENILPVKICSHPVVNAIVSRSLAKARKQDIQMDLHVEVPAGITVADNDLCTLLMNMLDNAIEAVSELDREKPHIELTMHVRGRYLFVETLNPYTGTLLKDEKTGLPVSSKGAGHGYGMKAMSDVAKKYSSKLQVKQEHGILMVRTALLVPEKQE